MAKFSAHIGDLFQSEAQTLVNTVNCVGVMGKGVAAEFKKRFPAMFEDYVRRCAAKTVHLGEPYLYTDLSGTRIVNFPTKNHWRSPSRIEDVENGLDYLNTHARLWEIKSIALPPLGCGNGGLDWLDIGPLIYRKLSQSGFDVELYAPFGTPKSELTEEFLSSPVQLSLSGDGKRLKKLNPNWVILLEVIRELQAQPFANPVGRTIFQKIAYVITELGVSTGFDFRKGSYGPFSEDVKIALHDFANRNWTQEEPLGKMVVLRVGSSYDRDRRKFESEISLHKRKIDKTVDLFSRIQNTEQAEEVVTVLFASRELKRSAPQEQFSEKDLYKYIVDWKKSWSRPDKKTALTSAIRNLVVLGWINLAISEDLIEAA